MIIRYKKIILKYEKTKDDDDYEKLARYYKKIKSGEIDKKVLLKLIKEDEPVVRLWAAGDMLK